MQEGIGRPGTLMMRSSQLTAAETLLIASTTRWASITRVITGRSGSYAGGMG
jgi:hypothetical protein